MRFLPLPPMFPDFSNRELCKALLFFAIIAIGSFVVAVGVNISRLGNRVKEVANTLIQRS